MTSLVHRTSEDPDGRSRSIVPLFCLLSRCPWVDPKESEGSIVPRRMPEAPRECGCSFCHHVWQSWPKDPIRGTCFTQPHYFDLKRLVLNYNHYHNYYFSNSSYYYLYCNYCKCDYCYNTLLFLTRRLLLLVLLLLLLHYYCQHYCCYHYY